MYVAELVRPDVVHEGIPEALSFGFCREVEERVAQVLLGVEVGRQVVEVDPLHERTCDGRAAGD